MKENMDRLLDQRTSFVIAHRLSTVRGADLIVVLEQGKIVERAACLGLCARAGLREGGSGGSRRCVVVANESEAP